MFKKLINPFGIEYKGPQRYLKVKNDISLLYLKGLRGVFEQKVDLPYNFFPKVLMVSGSIYFYYWLTDKFQNEYQRHSQPNILIPRTVYEARRENYLYWEMSRLARGKSRTFTFYNWDPSTESVYFTKRDGSQTFEKFSLTRESADIIENPHFEKLFRKYGSNPELLKDKKVLEYGNCLIAYQRTRKNRYNLDNYLHYKPINIFDIIRAVNYKIYIGLGLTNYYRHDHLIERSDFYYEFDKLRLALNLPGKDQNLQSANYMTLYKYFNKIVINFLESIKDDDGNDESE